MGRRGCDDTMGCVVHTIPEVSEFARREMANVWGSDEERSADGRKLRMVARPMENLTHDILSPAGGSTAFPTANLTAFRCAAKAGFIMPPCSMAIDA
jgi:hypothetical protein